VTSDHHQRHAVQNGRSHSVTRQHFAVPVGGAFVRQLWMFWVFPIIGGIGGGLIYRLLSPEEL
jgi:glycerol uptake facilitator-like aquaporin